MLTLLGPLIIISGVSCSDNNHEHEHIKKAAQVDPYFPSGSIEGDTRVIDVEAYHYGYSPDPIVVRTGEKVRLNITTDDEVHGLGIEEFGVDIEVRKNTPAIAEFSSSEPGDYPVECTVYCGSGHKNMRATLRVIK